MLQRFSPRGYIDLEKSRGYRNWIFRGFENIEMARLPDAAWAKTPLQEGDWTTALQKYLPINISGIKRCLILLLDELTKLTEGPANNERRLTLIRLVKGFREKTNKQNTKEIINLFSNQTFDLLEEIRTKGQKLTHLQNKSVCLKHNLVIMIISNENILISSIKS